MQRQEAIQFGETLYPVISLAADARGRFGGEPWVYANQIDMAPAKALPPGQVVRLSDPRGRHLGVYHFNPHSLIAARLLSRNPRRVVDRAFFSERLGRALGRRERLFDEPCYRLVHAEGDGLPGLIVDRYNDVLVVQPNTAGMTASLDDIRDALDRLLHPAAILVSASGPARLQEGLADQHGCIAGTAPEMIWARENGLDFRIDPLAGQKTGWFYDHRENRAFAARLARGQRVLDLYTYAGGFALTAAAAGAAAVTALDRSGAALALASASAERNRLALTTVEAEAFAWLDGNEAVFDVVIADPPAFAKKRRDIPAALKGYAKLARQAARATAPGGYLCLASCSHHVEVEAFLEACISGLKDAGRSGSLLRQAGAGPDHPVHPALPQTAYLKFLAFALD